MSGFPYWRGANPFPGGGAAAQTLTFDAATNALSISAGNTVTLTPTDLNIPGLLDVGQNLTVTGVSNLIDGFVSTGDSSVTRPVAGTDALLQVRNFAGNGIGIRASDSNGKGSLEYIAAGTPSDDPSLSIDPSGNVTIPKTVGILSITNPALSVPNGSTELLSLTVASAAYPALSAINGGADFNDVYLNTINARAPATNIAIVGPFSSSVPGVGAPVVPGPTIEVETVAVDTTGAAPYVYAVTQNAQAGIFAVRAVQPGAAALNPYFTGQFYQQNGTGSVPALISGNGVGMSAAVSNPGGGAINITFTPSGNWTDPQLQITVVRVC